MILVSGHHRFFIGPGRAKIATLERRKPSVYCTKLLDQNTISYYGRAHENEISNPLCFGGDFALLVFCPLGGEEWPESAAVSPAALCQSHRRLLRHGCADLGCSLDHLRDK